VAVAMLFVYLFISKQS